MTITTQVPYFKILDGALTDELVRSHNLTHLLRDPLWGATCIQTHPKAIQAVHDSYIDSGADIIMTSGYQAHPDNLNQYLDMDITAASSLLQTSLQLALHAIVGKNDQSIAVSMGSFGATLCDGSEYNGSFVSKFPSPEAALCILTDFHFRRLLAYGHKGLARAKYLAFETIPCIVEIRAIIAAIKQFYDSSLSSNTRPIVWISVTCKNSLLLGGGEPISEAGQLINEQGFLLGINCTPPQYISGLLQNVRQLVLTDPSTEIVVYPNKGLKWDAVDRVWSNESGMTDMEYALMACSEWVIPFGPLILGGCCQTSPCTISALRSVRSHGLVTHD